MANGDDDDGDGDDDDDDDDDGECTGMAKNTNREACRKCHSFGNETGRLTFPTYRLEIS